jgi:protein-tyrosine phosphatase
MSASQARHQPCPFGTEGGQNLRDLGGYPTRTGRAVRRDVLLRSGSMHFLTTRDHDLLQARGIRTVCDFRNEKERTLHPVAWPDGKAPRIFAADSGRDISVALIGDGAVPTEEEARHTMETLYLRILHEFNSQYRRMFAEMLGGNVPLIINCTAGKDRTGVAAALILTALDVPRDAVIEDYLLSNRYFDHRRAANASGSSHWQSLPDAVLDAYRLAHAPYLQAVFDEMESYADGIDGYFARKLGVGRDERHRLIQLYTH